MKLGNFVTRSVVNGRQSSDDLHQSADNLVFQLHGSLKGFFEVFSAIRGTYIWCWLMSALS
jgi:hypothetical protein